MCYKILKDQEKEKLTKCIFHWHEYFSVAAASTECYQSGLECFFFKRGKEILQTSELDFCLCSDRNLSVIDS